MQGLPAQVTVFGKNLGFDTTAAKNRSSIARQGTSNKRRLKAVRAQKRLSKLARAAGARIARMAKTNIVAKAAYCSPLRGISPTEHLQLRRSVGKLLPPFGGARSLTRLLAFHGDPTAGMAVAASVRWAREVWAAAAGSPDALGLTWLRGYWQEWHEAGGRRTWRTAKGPLDVVHLELRRVGWTFTSPFAYTDGKGDEVTLTLTSPKRVEQMLRQSTQDKLICDMADSKGWHCDPGQYFELAPLRRLARSARLDSREQGLLRAFGTNALWTPARQQQCGYEVPARCSLCGGPTDDLEHRLYRCTAAEVSKVRDRILAKAKRKDMISRVGEQPWLFLHGFVKVDWPEASGDPEPHWVMLGEFQEGEDYYFDDGTLFSAGSCSTLFDQVPGTRRAGWGVVQVEAGTGKMVAAVFGPVCRPTPQSAQGGEWTATAVAAQFARGGAPAGPRSGMQLHVDCSSVVQGWQCRACPAAWLNPRDLWAGHRRCIQTLPGFHTIDKVCKVAAHVKTGRTEIGPMMPMIWLITMQTLAESYILRRAMTRPGS